MLQRRLGDATGEVQQIKRTASDFFFLVQSEKLGLSRQGGVQDYIKGRTIQAYRLYATIFLFHVGVEESRGRLESSCMN